MISIVEYNECYDEQLRGLDTLLFYKAKYHPDLVKGSIHFAVEGEKMVGAALLLKRGSFLAIEKKELEYHELILEYEIAEDYIEKERVLEELLSRLKENCNHIATAYPQKRIFIKTWAMEEEHNRIECLMRNGFIVGRGTPILVRSLLECTSIDTSIPKVMEVEVEGKREKLELKEIHMDEQLMHSYEVANENAFVAADSTADIWFKLNAPDVKIFAAMLGDQVISSVMIWNINETRSATENIFCLDKYRRKGITTELINYVCAYLKQNGFTEASLTVFQDNIPAFMLYEKLGYRYEKFMFGLQYMKDYTAIPY